MLRSVLKDSQVHCLRPSFWAAHLCFHYILFGFLEEIAYIRSRILCLLPACQSLGTCMQPRWTWHHLNPCSSRLWHFCKYNLLKVSVGFLRTWCQSTPLTKSHVTSRCALPAPACTLFPREQGAGTSGGHTLGILIALFLFFQLWQSIGNKLIPYKVSTNTS